jgi:hypothetical protein
MWPGGHRQSTLNGIKGDIGEDIYKWGGKDDVGCPGRPGPGPGDMVREVIII